MSSVTSLILIAHTDMILRTVGLLQKSQKYELSFQVPELLYRYRLSPTEGIAPHTHVLESRLGAFLKTVGGHSFIPLENREKKGHTSRSVRKFSESKLFSSTEGVGIAHAPNRGGLFASRR